MFRIVIAAAVLAIAGPVAAQQTDTSSNAAVKDNSAKMASAPAKGANSFTEKQARKRIAKAGYAVTSLTKDDNGVWTGTATKGGKSMTVGLDFKGNVTAR